MPFGLRVFVRVDPPRMISLVTEDGPIKEDRPGLPFPLISKFSIKDFPRLSVCLTWPQLIRPKRVFSERFSQSLPLFVLVLFVPMGAIVNSLFQVAEDFSFPSYVGTDNFSSPWLAIFCEPKTSAILVTAVVIASSASCLSDDFSKLHAFWQLAKISLDFKKSTLTLASTCWLALSCSSVDHVSISLSVIVFCCSLTLMCLISSSL